MKLENLKILAMVDSLLLWDRLAETGMDVDAKYIAISDLYDEGVMSDCDYKNDCPFCEYLKETEELHFCANCLWPANAPYAGPGDTYMRCIGNSSYDTVYDKWRKEDDPNKRGKLAKRIFNMLYTLEMD